MPAQSLFRASGRRLLAQRHAPQAHWARLQAALNLADAEPIQGALADMFWAIPDVHERCTAMVTVGHRLSAPAAQAFRQRVSRPDFPACTTLATRWSLLVSPSLDTPRRAMRCNPDDSRRLALSGVQAWSSGDALAQDAFLAHCQVCRDTLAFMLARRALLQQLPELPAAWETVSLSLQQAYPPS